MTIDKIAYEQLYPTGVYANQRYRVEVSLGKGDMVEDAFAKAKTIVEETFIKLNPQINWKDYVSPEYANHLNGIQPIYTIDVAKEKLAIAIENSLTIEELKQYETPSMKYDLVQEYINKKKQLS